MPISTTPHLIERTALLSACGPMGARHGWLALHGLNQRAADFGAPFDALGGPRRVLLPEGPSRTILDPRTDRTGACWTTIPDRPHDLRDTMPWLDTVAGQLDAQAGDGQRVLLGFSQGGIIAARWAISRPRIWDAIVLWGIGIPNNVDPHALAARSKTGRLHLVIGDHDHYATPERRAAMEARLHDAGVAFELIAYPGRHAVTLEPLRQLAAHLEA